MKKRQEARVRSGVRDKKILAKNSEKTVSISAASERILQDIKVRRAEAMRILAER